MAATEEIWPRELGRQLTRWHIEAGTLVKGENVQPLNR